MIRMPKRDNTPVMVKILLRDISLSSVLINCETNTELKKMATKSDDPSTTDNVIGR